MARLFIFAAIISIVFSDNDFGNVEKALEVFEGPFNITDGGSNGELAKANQFPYQALVYIETIQGYRQCGGAIISDSWVFTAAQCVFDASSIKVLLGANDRFSMPVLRDGIKIDYPKSFNPLTLTDDIALILLSSDVSGCPNSVPIKLPTISESMETYSGTILVVSGFESEACNKTSELQYTEVYGICNTDCVERYNKDVITTTKLCTLEMHVGKCIGEAGNPLVTTEADPTLVGIASFGLNCDTDAPQVHTRVGPYIEYISFITGIDLKP